MRRFLLIVMFVFTANGYAASANYYLDVVNTADNSIVSFAAAPIGSNHFRDVALGDRPLQGGGDSATVALGKDDSGCLRDFRTEFSNGRVLIQRNFDVCKYRSYHTGRYLRGQAPTVVATLP